MRFYLAENQEKSGRTVCSTQKMAGDINKNYVTIDVPTDKPGLMSVLQDFYDELDRPTSDSIVIKVDDGPKLVTIDDFGDVTEKHFDAVKPRDKTLSTREDFDEAWESFPLALQLHYASLATELAREKIRE